MLNPNPIQYPFILHVSRRVGSNRLEDAGVVTLDQNHDFRVAPADNASGKALTQAITELRTFPSLQIENNNYTTNNPDGPVYEMNGTLVEKNDALYPWAVRDELRSTYGFHVAP